MTIENSACDVKEQENRRDREKFFNLLQSGYYGKAREFVYGKIGNPSCNLLERAIYCRAGYEYLEGLMNRGEFKQAKRCADSLRALDFNLIYQMLRDCRKSSRDKPYKAGRRN